VGRFEAEARGDKAKDIWPGERGTRKILAQQTNISTVCCPSLGDG
jgi:hypothetical protein